MAAHIRYGLGGNAGGRQRVCLATDDKAIVAAAVIIGPDRWSAIDSALCLHPPGADRTSQHQWL